MNDRSWIDRRLGQLGIVVRQIGDHSQMREYIKLLKEEVKMTERFLAEDTPHKTKLEMPKV